MFMLGFFENKIDFNFFFLIIKNLKKKYFYKFFKLFLAILFKLFIFITIYIIII